MAVSHLHNTPITGKSYTTSVDGNQLAPTSAVIDI